MSKVDRLTKIVASLLFSFILCIIFSSSFVSAGCTNNPWLSCSGFLSTVGPTTAYTIWNANPNNFRSICNCVCSAGHCTSCSNAISDCTGISTSGGCGFNGLGCSWLGCTPGFQCSDTAVFKCTGQQVLKTDTTYNYDSSCGCTSGPFTSGPFTTGNDCSQANDNYWCNEGASSGTYFGCTACAPNCNNLPYTSGGTCINGGTCSGVSCISGHYACDGSMTNANGCETNIWDDVNNCGSCNYACGTLNVASRVCASGTCSPSCNYGYAACGAGTLGCSINILTDSSNCGYCTHNCGSGNYCYNGNCVPQCSANSYVQCLSNHMYWYDTCNNRGGPYSPDCTEGCVNGQNYCCAPESNAAFCSRLGKNCGSYTANDNCGYSRTANCGSCSGRNVCSGSNVCTAPAIVCGDSYVDSPEKCDTNGPNLNGHTCETEGLKSGTLKCNPTCTAFDTSSCCVSTYGNGCNGPANSCGQRTAGTIGCSGSCTATTAPANPAYYGQSCNGPANSCGQTIGGTKDCNNVCTSTTAPPNPGNLGNSCGSCGGHINCAGSCDVATPGNYNQACGSCGGHITCSGSCSVATPGNYGNSCGSCGGHINCAGSCDVTTPGNYGNSCGSCGGTYTCSGSCSIATPGNYNNLCNGPANACGSRNTGNILCSGSCSATTAPPNPVGYGNTCYAGTGVCRNSGNIGCSGCNAVAGSPTQSPNEWSCDNQDNDCDGMTDESITQSQGCSVTGGSGTQSQTCTAGGWGSWSSCCATSCTSGYSRSGCVCNAVSCVPAGGGTQSCSLPNVASASQSRGCSSPPTWDATWGPCIIGSCDANHFDCDGIDSNGCEVSKSVYQGTLTSCNAVNCNAGYSNCDGNVLNGCELSTSVYQGTLTSCGVVNCNAGYLNCDGNVLNGCEVSKSVTQGTLTSCGVVNCNAGYLNCDGNVFNGCELSTSVYQGTLTSCNAVNCNAGYSNCDGNVLNGCEVQLGTNSNCASCGDTCSGSTTCTAGSCVVPTCVPAGGGSQSCSLPNVASASQSRGCTSPPTWDATWGPCIIGSCSAGYLNCDGIDSNGCEVSKSVTQGTLTSCNAVNCNAGYSNCDGNVLNGCEVQLGTNSNCASCGNICSGTTVCSAGTCIAGAVCGDNVKQTPNSVGLNETCDGNDLGGKSCSDYVSPTGANFDGGTLSCFNSCNGFNTSSCKYCGDGVKNDLEACDDGNTVSGDGCSSICQLESCGDSVVTGLEECDDGIANNGWGHRCSSICAWQNCTINSITFAPNCYNGPFSNNVFACAGGNGFDATVNFTGTNCSKASFVQIDLSNAACDVTYIGGTSALTDSGTNFISTPSNVGNNIYTVHFNLTGFVSDVCTGAVLTNYTALLRGGIGTPIPSRSKDLKFGLLNNNITLSQCNLYSYTSYDAVRFMESPQFIVVNSTPISNVCDKFFVKNTFTNTTGTKNLRIINNSVSLNYTCGILDAVCPDDFAAVTVCGYNSSGYPNDPDCGTHVWMKCSNVTLNHTAPYNSLGNVTCVPSIVPSNTHRACLDASGCMYYDGSTKQCYSRGNLINTTNGLISCSVNNNVWCIPGFEYNQVLKICTRVSTACDEGVGTTTSVNGCGTLRYAIMYQGMGYGNNDTAAIMNKCIEKDTSGKYTTACSPSYSWGVYYFYDQQNITVK